MFEASTQSAAMSEAERGKVREQLSRLLDNHHFKNSRRYPPLLRFIVEETLAGRGDHLKERLIGVSVFDRPPDYDTAADPVVRVTIAEVRKRIAQYYLDEEHDAEIRIELMPGRYAPHFRVRNGRFDKKEVSEIGHPSGELLATAVTELPQQADESSPQPQEKKRRLSRNVLLWLLGTLGFLTLAVVAFGMERELRPAPIKVLWAPLLGSNEPVLFCLPTDVGKTPGPASTAPRTPSSHGVRGSADSDPTFLSYETLGENIVFSDMLATLHIGRVLAIEHHDYRVKLNVYTDLEDLRQGPSILIGGLDNQWTLRALAPLRYRFAGSDADRYWIADAKDPMNKRWSLDLKVQYATVTRDYAIVARLHNEQTGQPQMIVAGIGMSGTAAAGEFISDERNVDELRRRPGAGFKDKDFEIVLSTDVVNGIAGTPKIVAVSVM